MQLLSKRIAADEHVLHCVSCNKTMHLNEKCAGLSKTAIAAIKEIGANLLLFCNQCVATSRKELVLSSIVRETASLDLRNEYADLKNAVQDIRESVEKVAEKATTDSGGRQEELTGLTSCVKDLKKTFAQVAAMLTSTVASQTTDTAGIRIRGVSESSSGDALQRELDDLEEVRKVFLHLNFNCIVTGLKRFGRRDTSKPGNCRTLIVNVSNQEDKRIILLSARKM